MKKFVFVKSKKKKITECDGGAVAFQAAPVGFNNLSNTNGIGNVVPPSSSAMTAAEQSGIKNMGSGDKFSVINTKTSNHKKKKISFGKKKKNKGK